MLVFLLNNSLFSFDDTITSREKIKTLVSKVNEAALLIKKEGKKKAYKIIKDEKGPFFFLDTYIWVNTLDGIMEMHPIKPQLNGKDIKPLRDISGRFFVLDILKKAKREKYGWVEYLWPKPGETKPSQKVSYIKLIDYKGEKLVVCSGLYDLSMNEIYAFERSKK